jgi:PAS domain S-box-containing protein
MFSQTPEALRAIIELAPDAILVINAEGRIALANRQVCPMFGYGPNELLGQELEVLVPNRFHAQHRAQREQFAREQRTRTMGEAMDVVGLRKDGSEVHLDIKLSPFGLGGERFVVGIIRDITHIRIVEKDLRNSLTAIEQLNQRLTTLNEEKNQLLGTAAHDLRNPLHALLSATECLMLLPPDSPSSQSQGIYQHMKKALAFMTKLVDGLVDMSAIESGLVRLDLAPINMNDKIEECLAFMSSQATEKSIDLQVHTCAEPLPLILADSAKVLQSLNNLVGNALKYAPSGSAVLVRPEPWKGGVRVHISDLGPGIPEEIRYRLFLPFQRGLQTRTEDKSVGLGLAIVKRIVEAHHGSISLESQPAHGTTFVIWFPMHPDRPILPPEGSG